ncbi:MAG: alpha/beta fold hydrolase [Alphaproteobacteria bacterium]|nr:alpha/beta fold hydrolase [Alphaproteobacteria bacterium]
MGSLRESYERIASLKRLILDEPEKMEHQSFAIGNSYIRAAKIPPAEGKQEKGQVILATGFNESFHDHYERIKYFTDRGYTVFTPDWAGQGTSGQKLGQKLGKPRTDGHDDDVRDLDILIRDKWKIDFSKPTFVFGYSTGAHIVALWEDQNPDLAQKLAGNIFPALMADLKTPKKLMSSDAMSHEESHQLSQQACDMGLENVDLPNTRTKGFDLTYFFKHSVKQSGNALKKLNGSARDHFGSEARLSRSPFKMPTFGWVAAAYRTLKKTASPELWKNINVPTLILTGTKDEVVDIDANVAAAANIPDNKGQHITLEGVDHSLWSMNDEAYDKMFGYIETFMDECVDKFHLGQYMPSPANDIGPVITPKVA